VYKDSCTRLERAERRLRSAEALVLDLRRAVADECSLTCFNTGSARKREREDAAAEYDGEVVLQAPARDLAELLAEYGRACVRAHEEPIEAELQPLLARASSAGLGLESFAALIEGREERHHAAVRA
jgi:hypothetical protein